MSQPSSDHPRIPGTIFGPTAIKTYDALIKRCRDHVRSLTTVQFDPETGIRRHFFNGKLERTVKVRGAQDNNGY